MLTVLFTDIVGSTELAATYGDRKWRDVLDRHDEMVRDCLKASRGREVKTVGDGFMATFDSPGLAIACAEDIVRGAQKLQMRVRAGVHTGEVEHRGRDLGGIGVHLAARIAALAEADQILVSSTVKDLCDGSEIAFASEGRHVLKGIPGPRQIFSVASEVPATPAWARRASGNGAARVKPVVRASKAAKTSSQSAAQPITVMIVDDHPLWRDTLRRLLEKGGARVVHEVGNGAEAVQAAADHKPDVVLMDIDMPGLNGIQATREISSALPGTKVIMLSSMRERDEVLAAVRAGACGYLLKTTGGAEIADAIRRTHAGEMVFPSELTTLVLAELRNPGPSGLGALTDREERVLARIADGLSNEAIARELHVSPKTVEVHVASIFTKLGLEATPDQNRRVQAAAIFLRSPRLGRG
jgi:DNA-binding NarL/FixJ family response regulator